MGQMWFKLFLAVILFTVAQCSMAENDMTKSEQTEYFKPINLTCDSIRLNVTENWSKIDSMRWMLPNAQLIMDTQDKIKVFKANGIFPYMLMIDRVGDDEFGYYTCIIVYKPVNNMPAEVQVVRWGLNIDGPDFSKLRAEYADHAVVGAIAAGILLGVLGISCILWHYRYNARKKREKLDKLEPTSHLYHNSAYDNVDEIKTEKPIDQPNGSSPPTKEADTSEIDVHM